MRYESVEFCQPCKRPTPRLRRGGCTVCRQRDRKARRLSKTSLQGGGSGLVRFGALLKLVWDLWSVWIRALATGCEMCGAALPPEKLQGAHGWSRQARRIMFDLSNVSALCADCHRRHTPPGPAWFAWMRDRLGDEEYDRLQWRADHGPKLTAEALGLLLLDAQQRIAALPEGPRKSWALERQGKILERQTSLGVRCA